MSTIGKKFHEKNKSLKNFLAYSDGEKNLFEISNIINLNLKDTLEISKILEKKGLI
jgi:aminopeptidase-like protein